LQKYHKIKKRTLVARTLGKQLDDVQNAIEAIETGRSQSYEIEGRKMTYLDLASLYRRESALLKKIELHGRDFIEGQNSKPTARRARVVFS
jgi:hypothetical protein